MTAPVLDIVLPCLDEAAALPWLLDRIPAGARAIVVDNGSRDGSPDIARAHGATVVNCAARGYGAACHVGLEAAVAEFVAFCDCDASLDPAVAVQFVDELPMSPTQKVHKLVLRESGVGPGVWDREAAGIVLRRGSR